MRSLARLPTHLLQSATRSRPARQKPPPDEPQILISKVCSRVLPLRAEPAEMTKQQHTKRALALFRGGGGDTFMAERARVHVTRLQTTYNALMFNHEKLKLWKVAGKKYGQCILFRDALC
jgi:hypothetical protein